MKVTTYLELTLDELFEGLEAFDSLAIEQAQNEIDDRVKNDIKTIFITSREIDQSAGQLRSLENGVIRVNVTASIVLDK